MASGRLIELRLSDLRGHAVEAGLLIERARGIVAEVAMQLESDNSGKPDPSGKPIPQEVHV